MSNVNAQIFQPWDWHVDSEGNGYFGGYFGVVVTFGGVEVFRDVHPPRRTEPDAVADTLNLLGHKLRRLLSDAEEDPCE